MLVNVGLPGKDQSYNPFSLVTGLKSIAGANTGNIADTQEMLDFCAEHNIVSTIELLMPAMLLLSTQHTNV